MSSIPAIALSGLSAACRDLEASAHNVANLGSADFRRQEVVRTPEPGGGVSTAVRPSARPGNALEADIVGQLQARNAFLANLAVFRANGRMTGALLDVVS